MLLSTVAPARFPSGFLASGPAYQAVRPNTPVVPFGSPLATASFIDPSARLLHGQHIFVGRKSFVGPDATLNAKAGFIKIGRGSAVLDNATIIATPKPRRGQPTTDVLIGDKVAISFGATIVGESKIGGYGALAKATGVGSNALIDNATISPGAIVGALARVGPGVVVPSGMYVLPGANVTTTAQASNPALGKVEPIPASIAANLNTSLARSTALALGYVNLYQGNSAAGLNPGAILNGPNIDNGNLATVLGVSQEPGAATSTAATGINFEPTSKIAPSFMAPNNFLLQTTLNVYPARIVGDVRFAATAKQVAAALGRSNSIRGDQGQPILFASAPVTGAHVTITSQYGGVTTTGTTTTTTGILSIGANFLAQQGVVVSGGANTIYTIGDHVTLGADAVIANSSIGANVTIGAKSYISGSTVAAGAVVPPGTILINNAVVGHVQW